MKRIFLVGLMGSGKTYWGKKIAALLKWKFIDLDRLVEETAGSTIPAIFEKYGEPKFRELETKHLRELDSRKKIVVATGGGTPCFHGNMDWMNERGETYYLVVKPEAAAVRLKNKTTERPLLKGKSEKELVFFFSRQLKEREPFYSKAKHSMEVEKLSVAKLPEFFSPGRAHDR